MVIYIIQCLSVYNYVGFILLYKAQVKCRLYASHGFTGCLNIDNDVIINNLSVIHVILILISIVLCEFYHSYLNKMIDFNSLWWGDTLPWRGHLALVSCPNWMLYSSEACPQGHTALGYNFRGGCHVTQ